MLFTGQRQDTLGVLQSTITPVVNNEDYFDSEDDEEYVPASDFSSSFLCKSMLDESDLYLSSANDQKICSTEESGRLSLSFYHILICFVGIGHTTGGLNKVCLEQQEPVR